MWRSQNLTPSDLLLEMASVLAIREDENPSKFSVKIQDEKKTQFDKETKNGNFFFMNHKAFNSLKPSLIMSEDEYKKHWNKLIQQRLHNEKRLATILQEKQSGNESKATTR